MLAVVMSLAYDAVVVLCIVYLWPMSPVRHRTSQGPCMCPQSNCQSSSEDWRHPRGWPRQTWLCSVKLDFQPHNLGIDSEWKCAQDRSKWHQLCSLKGESPSDDDSNLILAVLTALEEDLYQWHSSVLKSRWWSGVFVLQMLNCWLHVIYSRQSVMSPMWWWLSERAPTLFILGCLSCHPCDDDSLKELPLSHRLAMICGTSTCHITVRFSTFI